MKKALLLNLPEYDGFDGDLNKRSRAEREIRSFRYATWLAQPAATVPASRVVDAPPDGLTVCHVTRLAREYEFAVLHTDTFPSHARFGVRLNKENPRLQVAMAGGMLHDCKVMRRRQQEGVEFFRFLHEHKHTARPLATVGSSGD